MADQPVRHRPKMYPPPEFPPRKVALFANTPPAIFPVVLGLLGLATALRIGTAQWGAGQEIADLASGLVLPLWAFAACAYIVKMSRRISVIMDDLKVLPSRAGLAAGTLGGMVAAGHLGVFAPAAATGMLLGMLVLHAVLVMLVIRVLLALPPEARQVNPGWHMIFVGFIVAGPPAALMGLEGLARGILFAMLPVALAIWAVSLVQLSRRVPPAPLRPMLAIHLAPASLLATTASLTGQALLAQVLAVLALVLLLALAISARWITEAGFSALWGAFTFPMAAAATALMLQGWPFGLVGQGLLLVALGVVPWIAYRVLKLWPGGRLAAKTNAAEA
jgi:tellurite resistance protein